MWRYRQEKPGAYMDGHDRIAKILLILSLHVHFSACGCEIANMLDQISISRQDEGQNLILINLK